MQAIFIFLSVGILITIIALLILKKVSQVGIRLQERDRSIEELRQTINEQQLFALKLLQESIQTSMQDIRSQITALLTSNAELTNNNIRRLIDSTDLRLKEISGQVERRLLEGFAQTNNVFTDVVKRLALIDEAQKKITDLSSSVVDLQTLLADKRSRGAFGEVQLAALIRNIIPESNFILQHTLSNGTRVDCILLLPQPTANIAIDAKFPLENYRRLMETNLTDQERRNVEQQFRSDIRKHLQDIASKYIVPNETADGAVMFIPAEAVFAEIHAHYHDLVELSHQLRVWMVSPTTMMAVLTTARAVLKDAATRKQVHLIREHLNILSQDFGRFQKRLDDLALHINKAHTDLEQVHKSSQKITARFTKIEQVEFDDLPHVLQQSQEND